MKEFLLDFYGYFIFFYSISLIISYITLMSLSFFSHRASKLFFDVPYVKQMLTGSPYTPGISIVAPAYNEERTIIDNVHSLLALDYPKYEVIIVNDGSTDSTLEKMIKQFDLVEVPFAYREKVKSRPVHRLFKSTNDLYQQLTIVDKENGGTKADASNAGINVVQYPYYVCTDVDCILEKTALYRIIWPVLNNHTRVIAVSATMVMTNGCTVKEGKIVRVKAPRTLIPLFQNLEYMRSYLVGKTGWSAINAMPNVSGGFGLFDTEIAIAVGGYDSSSFAEDMDMVIRMVTYMCDSGRQYKIVQIPKTCCWTEGPSNLFILNRQRTRWGRGLLQYFSIHHKVLFNAKYRQMGLITLPYLLLFEFAAPIIEATGFFVFLWLVLTDAVNWDTMWIIFFMIYGFCQFLTIVICFFDYYIGSFYQRSFREYLLLILASLFEPFIYHPFVTFFSIKGYFSFLTTRNFKWGEMTRKGFKGGDQSEEQKEEVLNVSARYIPENREQERKEEDLV
ncbi:MAG: glycosyltransferase [Bacteroidaceae bacterium]